MVVIVEMISLGMNELSVSIKVASNKGGNGYAIDVVFFGGVGADDEGWYFVSIFKEGKVYP